MVVVKKTEFAKEIWVSTTKLDNLMEKFWFNYEDYPRDEKVRAVSEEAQKKIKEYLGIID